MSLILLPLLYSFLASQLVIASGNKPFNLNVREAVAPPRPAPLVISRFGEVQFVTVSNNYSSCISVYWRDEEVDRFLVELQSMQNAVVEVFSGDLLLALTCDGRFRLSPNILSVNTLDYFYEFDKVPDLLLPSSVTGGSAQTNALSSSSVEDPKTAAVQPARRKHRKHPLIRTLAKPRHSLVGMIAKFRSLLPTNIDIYFDDGKQGIFQGVLTLGKDTTTSTYVGHNFFFTEHGNRDLVWCRVTMNAFQALYPIYNESFRPTASESLLNWTRHEIEFNNNYLARTGRLWKQYYHPDAGPRRPPIFQLWPAQAVGVVHRVHSFHGHWSCHGDRRRCQEPEMTLELEVISTAPRIFVVSSFLSRLECEELIHLASRHTNISAAHNSNHGNRVSRSSGFMNNNSERSSVRLDSSQSWLASASRERDTPVRATVDFAWIERTTNAITETISLRIAELLQIDQSLLYNNLNAEDLQVLHYEIGQKSDAHHDWSVSGSAESRFVTILLYLNDMKHENAGGETNFPKGNGGTGFKLLPRQGTAVVVYNLLPDGNGDDLAQHGSLPVVEGEKWMAKYWVWDPKRRSAQKS